jgi:hypothetical protein
MNSVSFNNDGNKTKLQEKIHEMGYHILNLTECIDISPGDLKSFIKMPVKNKFNENNSQCQHMKWHQKFNFANQPPNLLFNMANASETNPHWGNHIWGHFQDVNA